MAKSHPSGVLVSAFKKVTHKPKSVGKTYTGTKRSTAGLSPTVLTNEQDYYSIDFTVGTPAQSFNALLDTGSSDIYVFDASAKGLPSGSTGYQPKKSSTYKLVDSKFSIGYGDGSNVKGNHVSDNISIDDGQTLVKSATFGDATTVDSSLQVFGIGLAGNESQGGYDNFPVLLKKQGLVQANAYSLYLDDYATSSGNLIFGGLDTAKFTAPLVTLPLVSVDDGGNTTPQPVAFFVTVDSVSINTGSTTTSVSTTPFVGLLDSGTTFSYLPSAIVSEIASTFGFTTDSDGDYVKPLSEVTSSNDVVSYTFGQLTINVPLAQIVLPDVDQNGNPVTGSDGEPLGILGLVSSGGDSNILGDTFLRAAYVVYDLDNYQVSIAQTKFDSTQSNIEVIQAGASGVPGAVPVSSTGGSSSSGNPKGSHGSHGSHHSGLKHLI